MLKRYFFTLCIVLIGVGVWITQPKEFVMTGQTMGTTYKIKGYKRFFISQTSIENQVNKIFSDIYHEFSTFDNYV